MKNTDNHTINSVLFPLERGSSGWQDATHYYKYLIYSTLNTKIEV